MKKVAIGMQFMSYLYQWMEVGNCAFRAPQHKDIFLRAHLLVDHLQAEDPYASYYLIGRKKSKYSKQLFHIRF